MRQAVRLTEHSGGCYEHVPPVLRLDFDHVIRDPLRELRVQVGGGSIGRRVRAEVGPISMSPRKPGLPPRALEVPVTWSAAEHPALFPILNGQLRIGDIGHDTIELRLTGEYTPPLGALGAIGDRLAGHQAATVSLRAYLLEVAHRLDAKLAEHTLRLNPPPSTTPLERSS